MKWDGDGLALFLAFHAWRGELMGLAQHCIIGDGSTNDRRYMGRATTTTALDKVAIVRGMLEDLQQT
jgi:hypothetical protein